MLAKKKETEKDAIIQKLNQEYQKVITDLKINS